MSVSFGESSTPDNTRLYVIGDVHGHIRLLNEIRRTHTVSQYQNAVEL